MAKYIEEKELMEWVENWFEKNRYYHPYSKTNDIPIPELYDILEQIPTADVVERKKGKWLNKFVDGLGFNGLEFECSECGKRSAGRTNFCAYCGAQMKSE